MINCPNCGQKPGLDKDGGVDGHWLAYVIFIWANGYGYKKRMFCRNCGMVSDHEFSYETGQDIITISKPADKDSQTWHQ